MLTRCTLVVTEDKQGSRGSTLGSCAYSDSRTDLSHRGMSEVLLEGSTAGPPQSQTSHPAPFSTEENFGTNCISSGNMPYLCATKTKLQISAAESVTSPLLWHRRGEVQWIQIDFQFLQIRMLPLKRLDALRGDLPVGWIF